MARNFTYEEPCTACGKPTNYACDGCEKPYGHGCLFETGKVLTFPADPRNEDYEERPTWSRKEQLCLACYQEAKKHPPLKLWEGSSAETTLYVFGQRIEKGVMIPTGDDFHSWYRPPNAGKMLNIRWGDQQIELDTFYTVQLLDWLKANEQLIRNQAKATSDVLVPIARKDTERAIRADLGIDHPIRYDDDDMSFIE